MRYLMIVALLSLLLVACGNDGAVPQTPTGSKDPTDVAPAEQDIPLPPDGVLRLDFKESEDKDIQEGVSGFAPFKDFAAMASDYFGLPEDLEITWKDCLDATKTPAFVCYEDIRSARDSFGKSLSGKDLDLATLDYAYLLLVRSSSHVIADSLGLEADQEGYHEFMMILSSLDGDGGMDRLVDAASLIISDGTLSEGAAGDVDKTAAEKILCFAYGDDSDRYAYLKEQGFIKDSSACESLAQSIKETWADVLAPHLSGE